MLELQGLRAIAVAPALCADFDVQKMETRMFKQADCKTLARLNHNSQNTSIITRRK